jgi:hypothetical protein
MYVVNSTAIAVVECLPHPHPHPSISFVDASSRPNGFSVVTRRRLRRHHDSCLPSAQLVRTLPLDQATRVLEHVQGTFDSSLCQARRPKTVTAVAFGKKLARAVLIRFVATRPLNAACCLFANNLVHLSELPAEAVILRRSLCWTLVLSLSLSFTLALNTGYTYRLFSIL